MDKLHLPTLGAAVVAFLVLLFLYHLTLGRRSTQ